MRMTTLEKPGTPTAQNSVSSAESSRTEPTPPSKSAYARLYSASLYKACYALEKIGGAAAIPLITLPFFAIDYRRRQRDYAQFLCVRDALPAAVWKGTSPSHHYRRMIFSWWESLVTNIFYTRLGLPYWSRRFEVEGTPIDQLPEWGQRPVIVAFLHTGSFGLIRWYLRSRKIPTASLIASMPTLIDNPHYNKYLAEGDKIYGLEDVPHYFRGIRDAIRYLKPGRAMTMALDGGAPSPESDRQDAGGAAFYVKKGACRVGAQTGALVVPVSVRRKGFARYIVHFGKPVPDDLLQQGDFTAATQHLVSELWPDLESHPLDLNWTTMEAFAPSLIKPRVEWP